MDNKVKITDELFMQAWERHMNGETIAQIADHMGVGRMALHQKKFRMLRQGKISMKNKVSIIDTKTELSFLRAENKFLREYIMRLVSGEDASEILRSLGQLRAPSDPV